MPKQHDIGESSEDLGVACLPAGDVAHIHSLQTPPLKGTLFVRKRGRLGNWMFQIISTFMLSRILKFNVIYMDYSMKVTFPHMPVEEILEENAKEKLHGLPVINDTIRRPSELASALVHLLERGDAVLSNYMISRTYINNERHGKCRDLVSRFFTFSHTLSLFAGSYLTSIGDEWRAKNGNLVSSNELVYVGIHARRGDFLSIKEMHVPLKGYFEKAMGYFTSSYQNVVFVIASDDKAWCRDNLSGPRQFLTPSNLTREQDMAILCSCNHTIASVGTYGAWTAYLTGGIRIEFSHNFKHVTQPRPHPETKKIIFSN